MHHFQYLTALDIQSKSKFHFVSPKHKTKLETATMCCDTKKSKINK